MRGKLVDFQWEQINFLLKGTLFSPIPLSNPIAIRTRRLLTQTLIVYFIRTFLSFWGFSGLALHLSLPPWIKHIPEVSWHILDLVQPFSRWTRCVDILATAHLLGREFLSVSRVIGVILSGKTMSNDIRRSPLFVGSLD